MQVNANNGLLGVLSAIAPNVRATNTVSSRSAKRDTLTDARKKVADKLRANQDYFAGKASEQPDMVYKAQSDGTFAIAIKYGNRHLAGVMNGQIFACGIETEQMPAVFAALIDHVEAGGCDDAISKVMEANVGARKKVHH